MKIDNGTDSSRELIYLFAADLNASENENAVPKREKYKKPKEKKKREKHKVEFEFPPSDEEFDEDDFEISETQILPQKSIFKTKVLGNPVPVRTVPETRNEAVQCDLVALVDTPYSFTWDNLVDMGVTAEDVLFTERWQRDLVPAITDRLGLTWRELRDVGLISQMVVAHGRSLDFWFHVFRIDQMFFQTLLFKKEDFNALGWGGTLVRAKLGYEVWVNDNGYIELRDPPVRIFRNNNY